MASVFEKIRLTSAQLRTVANRRYDDADYLRRSEQNKHSNGVLYIGGFVLECLLKAALLDRYPGIHIPPAPVDAAKHRRRYMLLWSHDLAAMIEELPELLANLQGLAADGRYATVLRSLCGQWTIYARYSPHAATMQQASRFLDQIKELKPWLR